MFPVGRFLARALVLGSRSPSRHYAEAAAAATGPAQLAFTFASPSQKAAKGDHMTPGNYTGHKCESVPKRLSFDHVTMEDAAMVIFYNAAVVKQVDVPTLSGSFGILAAHVPTLQVLRPGIVTVFDEDGSSKKYFVSSGSLTVNADSSVQVLAEEVALLDQFDAATAKSNLDKALSELASATDEVAKAEAQINVEANEAIIKALE